MSVKIVHTITKLEFGGAQQNTLFTLDHLPPGYRAFLVCGRGGMLDGEAESSGRFVTRYCPFLIRKINPLYDFLAFLWLTFYFVGLKPDILHSHSSKAGILSRWAARAAGIKIIIHTFHGFGFNPLQAPAVRKFFVSLERITAVFSTKLIAVSYANVTTALNLDIGRVAQYMVVRSGIDIRKFEKKSKFANIKELFPAAPADGIIGNVSCFKPQKGLFDFIETCRQLNRSGDYGFILVGDGILKKRIEEKAAEAGLGKRLLMLGWRKDIDSILPSFDVLVHTSYFEGLARVFLEAMASGVPIIATAVDGALDVIEHGVNGYLARPGDCEAIAGFTARILADKELRVKMSEAARAKLSDEFDINTMSDTLNGLYYRLMKGVDK